MYATRLPVLLLMGILLGPAIREGGELHAQLPSPAGEAAEELIQVVRSGDDSRVREFIETRFSAGLRDVVPMEEHLRIFGLFRRDLEGREVTEVELRGPNEVSLILEGGGDRLELLLRVEPEPPHGIAGINVTEVGPELEATTLEELGAELERMAAGDGFSGVVLVSRSDGVVFHEAYGMADREAGHLNRPDTRFDIGSITKLFTATAILRLAQDGRLELRDRAGRYLDGFRPEVAERVTVEHLLRHRSGLGDYLTDPRFEADPKRFDRPQDFLPLAREQEPAFEPGTGRRYSNMGYVLLGAIIESVTGRDYHDVIDDMVFHPAGMTTAGATGGAVAARRYHRMPGELMQVDGDYPDTASPAGGAFAATMDLHRFAEALLDGRLLSPASTTLLLNDFVAPAAGAPLAEQFAFAGGADGVSAILLARPAERHVVVVLANIEPAPTGALARKAQELSR